MKTRCRQAGFSLVEVMLAVLILGLGLAGLARGMTTALRSNKDSETRTAAALLAAGQIEALRAEGYLVEETTEGEGDGGLEAYRWKRIITETRTEGLYEVEVVVERASTGAAIYELKTMLFDPPLTGAYGNSWGAGSATNPGGMF